MVGQLIGYPKQVIIALAHMVEYLSKLNISRVFRKQTRYKQYTERNHMLLNANTLTNLCVGHISVLRFIDNCNFREIYHNETDYREEGSLIGVLNKTKTKFGSRKLRELLGRPLLDIGCVGIKGVLDVYSLNLGISINGSTPFRRYMITAKVELSVLYSNCYPISPTWKKGSAESNMEAYGLCFPLPSDIDSEQSVHLRSFATSLRPFTAPQISFRSTTVRRTLDVKHTSSTPLSLSYPSYGQS